MMPTISRADFVAAVEAGVQSMLAEEGDRALPLAATLRAFAVEHVGPVAFASMTDHGVSCPLVQTGIHREGRDDVYESTRGSISPDSFFADYDEAMRRLFPSDSMRNRTYVVEVVA